MIRFISRGRPQLLRSSGCAGRSVIPPDCNDPDVAGTGGFTLIETMVVILIIGLIATLAVPYARALSPSARLESQATKVVAVLRAARASAIRTSEDQSVVIDTERFVVASSTAAAQIDRDVNIRVLFADRERQSASQAGIRFFPNGQSSGGRIGLSLGNLSKGITINWATGHAGIER